MSEDKPGKITTAIALHIRVTDWLRGKGYIVSELIGDGSAHCSMEINCTSLQIINCLGLKLTGARRKYNIGRLYIRDGRTGANGKEWVMEVFGREYMEQLTTLAEESATEFKVDIHVRLERERPIGVTYR